MEGGAASAGAPDDGNDEFVHFFEALGITDQQKTTFLGRLLEQFYDIGAKLDEHLAPTGAVLHCAVSRMVAGENPLDPPHHRWIRIHDRIGFFSNHDDHSCRVINNGLSFAYRYKELEAIAEANALVLEEVRLAISQRRGSAGSAPRLARPAPLVAGADDVPIGGRVLRDDGVAARRGGGGGPGDASAQGQAGTAGAGAQGGLSAGGEDTGDDLEIPTGGVELRRDPTPCVAGADVPENGGLVVPRRPVSDTPAVKSATADPLMVTPVTPASLFVAEQPYVAPSSESVEVVTAVLETYLQRDDAKGVIRQLLVDGLLCWGRLHSGQTSKAAAGVISATEAGTGWPAVRQLLTQRWPMWSAPTKTEPVLPPEGSVSRHTHPGREVRTSRWKVKVDMTAVNPIIKRLEVVSNKNFKQGDLDGVVEVQRVGPGMRVHLAVTIASTLLVATWDSTFAAILKQLAASGRAPVLRKQPIAAAACHDFEASDVWGSQTMGLAGTSDDEAAAGGSADAPASTEAAASLAAIQDERQAEVDKLLAADKAGTAGANRARRIEARRRERLSRPQVEPRPVRAALPPAGSRKRFPDAVKANGGSVKGTAPVGSAAAPADADVDGLSQVTAAPSGALGVPLPSQVVHAPDAAVVSGLPDASQVSALPDGSGSRPMSSPGSSPFLSLPLVPGGPPLPPRTPLFGNVYGSSATRPGASSFSLSPLRRRADIERVAATVREATHIAEDHAAVRFPSASPSRTVPGAEPASNTVAPSLSDSDTDVAMMDEDEEDD